MRIPSSEWAPIIAAAIGDPALREKAAVEMYDHTAYEISSTRGLLFKLGVGEEKVNNGYRSEISVYPPHKEGDIVEVTYKLFFPRSNAGNFSDNWHLVGQWHDKPEGDELWGNYRGLKPPVALFISEAGSQEVKAVPYFQTNWDPAVTGPDRTLKYERTYEIRCRIKWSQSDDAYEIWYLNDEFWFKREGKRNMINAAPHYFKLGQYRAEEDKDTPFEVYSHLKSIEVVRPLLTLEDGTGVKGAVSYVGTKEADRYFKFLGNSAWANASQDDKEAALVRASQYADQRWYTRISAAPLNPEQGLALPVKGLCAPSGAQITGIPELWKKAICEYAAQALVGDLFNQVSGAGDVAEKRVTVGPITTSYKYANAQQSPSFKSFAKGDTLVKNAFCSNNNGYGSGRVIR